ncbi:MAG: hypothetical protein RIS70_3955 [Planctomycetota bacterium]
MSASVRRTNNYFDGIAIAKPHLFVLAISVLSYFFEQMDNSNFSFIAPALTDSGFISKEKIATITSTYFLGMTLGGLLGGVLSDFFGRRKTFLVAVLLFSSASILNGITSDFHVFCFARAATGFGAFMMMVTSVAYIAEMTPSESRGRWQSLIAAAGFCAMPFIGILSRVVIPLSEEAWRYIFLVGGGGFFAFFLGLKYFPESPRWLVTQGRVTEAERVIRNLSGVDVDLSEIAANSPPKVKMLDQFIGMFSGKYLPRTLILLIFGIPLNIGAFVLTVWIPTLAEGKGFALKESLNLGIAVMLGGPVGMFISSFFADKGGRKIPMAILLMVLAGLAICYANLGKEYYPTLIVAFLLNAVSMGLAFIAMAYVPEHYPTGMRNTAVGMINAIQRLGVSASQFLIPLIDTRYGFKTLFFVIAGLWVFSAAVVLLFGRRTGGVSLEQIE